MSAGLKFLDIERGSVLMTHIVSLNAISTSMQTAVVRPIYMYVKATIPTSNADVATANKGVRTQWLISSVSATSTYMRWR